MGTFLVFISLLYRIILIVRNKLYDRGILKSRRFDMPVINVGNLSMGGTGKTPTVEYLINKLGGSFRLAMLSRGYGRKTKGFKMADAACTYEDLGDEPLQYFKKFPEITVAVDENRVEGVDRLLEDENPPEVILLDDAFQHRKITAGLNILLTEYQRLYSDDRLFPAGRLRDLKSSAQRADIIVVSKSPDTLSEQDKALVINKLNPTERQKVFFSHLDYKPMQPLNAAARNIAAENADAVLLFCGIARPNPLIDRLKTQFKQVEALTFADHHAYTENDIKKVLRQFESLAGERKIIVTTEKDAARLTNSPYLCQFESAPLYDLPVSVRFDEEEKFNEEILNYVRQNHHHR